MDIELEVEVVMMIIVYLITQTVVCMVVAMRFLDYLKYGDRKRIDKFERKDKKKDIVVKDKEEM